MLELSCWIILLAAVAVVDAPLLASVTTIRAKTGELDWQ